MYHLVLIGEVNETDLSLMDTGVVKTRVLNCGSVYRCKLTVVSELMVGHAHPCCYISQTTTSGLVKQNAGQAIALEMGEVDVCLH